jgi:hypothetical protein
VCMLSKCEEMRVQLFDRLGTRGDDVAIAEVRHQDRRATLSGWQTSGFETILLLHHGIPTSHWFIRTISQVKQVSIVVRGFDDSNNGYPSQGQMCWADGRHVRAVF